MVKRFPIVVAAVLALGWAEGCKKEEPMPTPPPKVENKPAGTGTSNSGAADTAKARLDAVKQLISEKKLDDADKSLKAVEAEKDKLPEPVQQEVADLRKALETTRAAAKAVDSGP